MWKLDGKGFTKSECLFFIYYVIFVISLFVDDLALDVGAENMAPILKTVVLIVLIVCALQKKVNIRMLVCFVMLFVFGVGVLLFTGDFFWVIVLAMGFCMAEIDEKYIFKLSEYVIVTLLLVTFFSFCLGLLPDVLSYRTDFSTECRHSFGFAHSTVLPLGIFYLMSYYICLKENKTKMSVLFILTILSIVIYFFCGSRNALMSSVLLVSSHLIVKNLNANTICGKGISIFAKFSFVIATIFSVVPMVLRSKGILMNLWYIYDVVFTNRSLLAASAFEAYGVHLLSNLKTADYVSTVVSVDSNLRTGIVLDNGYIYLLIRYGILILILMALIYNALYKTKKNNVIVLTVLAVVIFVNMTDNDFLSYGFLPYILIGIRGLGQKCKKV